MKRHALLQPLSDDHHRALVLARRVRRAAEAKGGAKGGASALAQVWRDAVARFASELEPHFQVEERWLFPLLEAAGQAEPCARARADHAQLREWIGGEATAASAVAFAGLLERHVRFEERELFPRAEELLVPDLETLAQSVAEAVRKACVEAALGGYQDASFAGVCHEGAWEAAISAIRRAPLADVAANAVCGKPPRRR